MKVHAEEWIFVSTTDITDLLNSSAFEQASEEVQKQMIATNHSSYVDVDSIKDIGNGVKQFMEKQVYVTERYDFSSGAKYLFTIDNGVVNCREGILFHTYSTQYDKRGKFVGYSGSYSLPMKVINLPNSTGAALLNFVCSYKKSG